MQITYKRVPFWNGTGFLLRIPKGIYRKVSDALRHTILPYGNGKIRSKKTQSGWIVYLHITDAEEVGVGYMTKEDLERYLDRVASKMSESSKTYIEVKL